MPQPTFTAIRQALATTIGNAIPGLRATTNPLQVNLPCAIVMPVTGTFVSYSQTFDGLPDYHLRVIVAVPPGDSQSGEGDLDAYIATSGASSVWAAVQASQTLGGVVSSAVVLEATAYGLMNLSGVDALAAHFIVEIAV